MMPDRQMPFSCPAPPRRAGPGMVFDCLPMSLEQHDSHDPLCGSPDREAGLEGCEGKDILRAE